MSLSRKRRRMRVLALCVAGLGSAAALALFAFQDNLVFFRSPSDVAAHAAGAIERPFRLGGLVENGSVARGHAADGQPEASFRVTDGRHAVSVTYVGVLPDLFREGQGVVTMGRLAADGTFRASEVLARHDESYMPPEVADALKHSGHWQPEQGAPPPAATWNTLSPASSPVSPTVQGG